MNLHIAEDIRARHLAATENEQFDTVWSRKRSGGSRFNDDDGDVLSGRALLTYTGHGTQELPPPNQKLFDESVHRVAEESARWFDGLGNPPAPDNAADDDNDPRSFLGSRLSDESFDALLEDALEISGRFKPEPVFARTGTGFLRSAGVADMQQARDAGNGTGTGTGTGA